MIFEPTPLDGVLLVKPRVFGDERGFFMESWNERVFADAGLDFRFVQDNHSRSAQGTLRGLHFQASPSRESKLVRCLRGSIFDVALDLRPDSPTYLRHHGAELSLENGRALYIPPGCAHGFQTLDDDTLVLYLMSDFHQPELSRGVRWNDPAFGIQWPIPDPSMLERDRDYPDFQGPETDG